MEIVKEYLNIFNVFSLQIISPIFHGHTFLNAREPGYQASLLRSFPRIATSINLLGDAEILISVQITCERDLRIYAESFGGCSIITRIIKITKLIP